MMLKIDTATAAEANSTGPWDILRQDEVTIFRKIKKHYDLVRQRNDSNKKGYNEGSG